MIVDVIVPDVGEGGMEVAFARWVRSEGDEVREGDPLFELDTAKAIVEVQAYVSGRLTGLQVVAGDIVALHQVVARIETASEQAFVDAPGPLDAPRATPRSDGAAPAATDSDPAAAGSPARSAGEASTSNARGMKASPRARPLGARAGSRLGHNHRDRPRRNGHRA